MIGVDFMTEKLYDFDSYLKEFDATVISCDKDEKGYKTVLDRTAFFPKEGGQCADKGEIDGICVTDVQIENGIIYHFTDEPFEKGQKVHGKIDFDVRFRNMQNHTGEHIVCGIAHSLFGYENVGFHLGETEVTMDLDGELTDADIKKIEVLANEAVWKNAEVTAFYPSEEELETLSYRSKSEIKDAVRIVTIEGIDNCACCAPHVKNTGEVGIIKIADFMRHRGGMRLTLLCGKDAYTDYEKRCIASKEISNLLSVPQGEIADGVQKLHADLNGLRKELSDKTKENIILNVERFENSDSPLCLFLEDADSDTMRLASNKLKEKTSSVSVVYSGNDENGYSYVMAVADGDIAPFLKDANDALSGRGGGKGTMASGRFSSTREKIENHFKNL